MSKERIQSLCKQLRLGSYIADIYLDIEANTHEDLLLTLLTEAVQRQAIERRNLYIQQAKFELMKGLDTFDFSTVTLPSSLTVDRFCSLSIII